MDFYDLKPTLSRGAVMSFVLGHRGAGKTYAFKNWAIRDYLSTSKEFVYARRLDSESMEIKRNLFDDIAGDHSVNIRNKGNLYQIRGLEPFDLDEKEKKEWRKENPWQLFGYSMSLNLQQDYKSGSWAEVNKMCYDEFIIENPSRRYLKDEPSQLVNLASTVFRHRKSRIVAFSNAGAMWNPYFDYYGINSEDLKQDVIKRNRGAVIFERFHSVANAEKLKQGLMGQLGNADYVAYAIDSQFRDVDENLIVGPDRMDVRRDWVNIVSSTGKTFTVKLTMDGSYYVVRGASKKADGTFTLSSRDYKHQYAKELCVRLREQFYRKNLFFDSIDSRLEVMNSINF